MTIKISKTKLMIMAICMLLVLNLSILSTMAWMTDTSSVTNTFTVGKVDITLEESDVDKDGKKDLNNYHLIPGEKYTKDPILTVKAGSEESYIRMMMTVHNASAVKEIIADRDLEDFFVFIEGWDKEVWDLVKTTEDTKKDTVTYEFRYKETVSGFDAKKNEIDNILPALFTQFNVPGELKLEDLEKLHKGGFKMVIEGHAIQKSGFDTANEAWAAFEEEEKE